MRTNIHLDEQLLEKAFKYANVTTKKDLIHLALQEFVANRSRKDMRDLRGKIRFAKGYNHKKVTGREQFVILVDTSVWIDYRDFDRMAQVIADVQLFEDKLGAFLVLSATVMRLFHFSDDPDIHTFIPRPVLVPAERPPGLEWLNGPLVWAIDEEHQGMYLFPRDCPRILLWRTSETTQEDYERWWQGSDRKMLAYIEEGWLERVQTATLYRYELPTRSFESLHDAGMWVSRETVRPLKLEVITAPLEKLEACDVELRVLEDLLPLKDVWNTSLHASGIRLRNARSWR